MAEGEQGEDMFIVHHGRVSIEIGGGAVSPQKATDERSQKNEGQVLGFLGSGDFFGEAGVLLPPSLAPPRSRSAYALEECELGVLCYEVIADLRARFPAMNEAMMPYVEQAYKNFQLSSPSCAVGELPDNVRYPGPLEELHSRMTTMQTQLDRIERLVSPRSNE
eukprot:SAG31_NODE_4843_length_2910_cov_2.040911_5_plen_164_part_00